MHATKTNEASRFFEVVEWSISVFQSHAAIKAASYQS